MIRPRLVSLPDEHTRRLQSAVSDAIVLLQQKNPILNGVFVEKSIGTSDTAVEHGLAKEPQGWIVVSRDADAEVWESSTENNRRQDKLFLQASAEVNVTLYVF